MISNPIHDDVIVKCTVDEWRLDRERTLRSDLSYLTRRLSKINTQHRSSMRKRERFAKRIRAKQARLVALLLTK